MRTSPDILSKRIGIYIISIAIAILAAGSLPAAAKVIVRDSVKVHFRLNKYNLDLNYQDNRARLDSLVEAMGEASMRLLTKITVVGGASPEGSIELNNKLSRRRAKSFIDYLDDHVAIPDSVVHYSFLGRDWTGL